MISYRRPLVADIEPTQNLFHSILETSFPMLPLVAITSYSQAWSTARLSQRITAQNDLLCLAWDNDTPVGLVSGTPPEGGIGTIIWLLVDKSYRSHHIGTSLLNQACDYYRKLGCHKIKLTAPSQEAKNFYVGKGMIEEGFHKRHWYECDFWALGMYL